MKPNEKHFFLKKRGKQNKLTEESEFRKGPANGEKTEVTERIGTRVCCCGVLLWRRHAHTRYY